jgi:geranylgeranyl reductase family protein
VVHVHDAVIVGAGPGGSATAYFLSRHGLDVLLLDRADFPRDKTCGDGLTPRALRVLDQMGILADVTAQGCPVDAYSVVAPNGGETSAPITARHGALVVKRLLLDDVIQRRALASGAHFASGVNVSRVAPGATGARVHAADGRTFEGRVAVIATGAAVGLLKRSGILRRPPRTMLAARTYFEELQTEVVQSFQLRFDDVPMPGYGWVFPVKRNAANIGVGFLPRRGSGTASQAFERFIRGAALRPLLEGARQAGPLKGYPIRVDFLHAPTFGERTLLVGESAGLVNPLTGEGIDYALESGYIAAEHLLHDFEADDFSAARLAQYHAQLHQRFDRIFRFSEWIRDWYCKPPLLNLLVPLANRRPELRQLLANIVLGEREPRGYGPATMLARLLVYLAHNPTIGALTPDPQPLTPRAKRVHD